MISNIFFLSNSKFFFIKRFSIKKVFVNNFQSSSIASYSSSNNDNSIDSSNSETSANKDDYDSNNSLSVTKLLNTLEPPKIIELIRKRYENRDKYGDVKYNFKFDNNDNNSTTRSKYSEAAVLMPFCIIDDKLSVLFTVRSSNLSTHQGEVSFPGGKKDLSDSSLISTVLRETYEEINVESKYIDIIGQEIDLPNVQHTLKVTPFIGFINFPKNKSTTIVIDEMIKFDNKEVDEVFTVTLEDLLDPNKKFIRQFRKSKIKYSVNGWID
ncbi:10971_t:CDS:2 [Entrophospora sp. SA101]|nr:10971_t:CDS:2 [Entrophospora sp. SA101]CAJ0908187.1 21707_t:CDS:2 [Entrophospora sp. SA101]